MRNRSLPTFKSPEYSADLRRKKGRNRRGIPTIALLMIGIYIAFLGYYLIVEDVLGIAPVDGDVPTEVSVPAAPPADVSTSLLP